MKKKQKIRQDKFVLEAVGLNRYVRVGRAIYAYKKKGGGGRKKKGSQGQVGA
jgi:hypothetical protein